MLKNHTDNVRYQPDTVAGGLAHLRASEEAHVKLGHAAISADGGSMFSPDLVLMGMLQRSLSLIDGFTMLVEAGNPTAAIPLLRLQVDNALRFYACSIAKDYNEVLVALLAGKPLMKVKSVEGRPMTDGYLVERISEHWSWVARVYKETSGFVHLSTPGVLSGVVDVSDDDARKVSFFIGKGAGRPWREKEKKEAVDAMVHATDIILQLVADWGSMKAQVGPSRAEAQSGAGGIDE